MGLQVELDQERATQKENYNQHLKEIEDALKEKEIFVNQLNEQNNNLKSELTNAKEDIEKAKEKEITQMASQKDLFATLQLELDQERINVSAQREKYDQQLKEINDTLKEKETAINQLNEQ